MDAQDTLVVGFREHGLNLRSSQRREMSLLAEALLVSEEKSCSMRPVEPQCINRETSRCPWYRWMTAETGKPENTFQSDSRRHDAKRYDHLEVGS